MCLGQKTDYLAQTSPAKCILAPIIGPNSLSILYPYYQGFGPVFPDEETCGKICQNLNTWWL